MTGKTGSPEGDMKTKSLIAIGMTALMLTGCGMPKVDFSGVDSPLFIKDESGAADVAASGAESVVQSDDAAQDSKNDDAKKPDNKQTGRTKTESGVPATESVPTDSSVAAGSTKNDQPAKNAPVQLAVERVSIYDYEHDSREDISYLSSDVQYLSLSKEDAEDYEKLAARLETLSDDTISACEDTFNEVLKRAKSAYGDNKSGFAPYEISLTAVPVRTDSSVFSYFEKMTVTGEESDEVSVTAHTVSSETGRELTLSKVIADTDSLPEILANHQKESYPDISEKAFSDMLSEYEDTDYVWTLGYDGITFYFVEEGEVIPITILRNEEKNLFRAVGEDIPDNYAVGLAMSQPYAFDLGGDGETDILTIEGREDVNGNYDGVTVTLNDEPALASFYCNSMLPAYIHTEQGDYIYLFCTEDNDYQQLNIFSLGKGAPSYSGNMDNMGRSRQFDAETDLTSEMLLTNPESFELSSNMDILSTYTASRSYYVDESGMPKSEDTYYYVDGDLVLKNNQTMNCSIVNERGRVTKKDQTIKTGTEWTIYRTDGVNTVDLILSDKRIARVVLDSVKWPQTIDGEDISDLFEGVRFAG